MPNIITESDVEQMCLDMLKDCGYRLIYGPDIAPDGETPKRKDYKELILLEHVRDAIDRLNPNIPKDAREQAIRLCRIS